MRPDVTSLVKKMIKYFINENIVFNEKYSRENNRVLNLFKNSESDFDVKANWDEICEYMDDSGLIYHVNVGDSPEDAYEMKKLDPIRTWKSLPEKVRKSVFSHLESEQKENRNKNSPTTHHMELMRSKPLPPNTWLLHYTDYGEGIARDGFQIGFSDENRLGLTTHFADSAPEKKSHGYNFGFLANNHTRNIGGYGSDIVMFQSSGIHVYHPMDKEEQIIFYGASINPSNIVLIRREDSQIRIQGEVWSVASKRGGNKRGLFVGNLSDCIKWVKDNFTQYKRLFASGSYNQETQKIPKIQVRAKNVSLSELLSDINGYSFAVKDYNQATSSFTGDFFVENQGDLKDFLSGLAGVEIQLNDEGHFDYEWFEEVADTYKYPINITPVKK